MIRTELQAAIKTALIATIKQGQRACDAKGSCRYRIGDLKCFIGQLITDEEYSPDMEYRGLRDPAVWNGLCRSLGYVPTDDEVTVLAGLQAVHDNSRGEGPRFSITFFGLMQGKIQTHNQAIKRLTNIDFSFISARPKATPDGAEGDTTRT